MNFKLSFLLLIIITSSFASARTCDTYKRKYDTDRRKLSPLYETTTGSKQVSRSGFLLDGVMESTVDLVSKDTKIYRTEITDYYAYEVQVGRKCVREEWRDIPGTGSSDGDILGSSSKNDDSDCDLLGDCEEKDSDCDLLGDCEKKDSDCDLLGDCPTPKRPRREKVCVQYAPVCETRTKEDVNIKKETETLKEYYVSVHVKATGISVLEGETERVYVSYNHKSGEPRIGSSGVYSNYDVSAPLVDKNGNYSFDLEATRKAVSSKRNLELKLENVGNKLVLVVTNPDYTSKVDVGQRLVTVTAFQKGIAGPKKFKMNRKYQGEKTFKLNRDSRVTRIETGLEVPKKGRFSPIAKKYLVKVESRYEGSSYFNSKSISLESSNEVKQIK